MWYYSLVQSKDMKSEIVATVVGGIVTVAALCFCFLAEKDNRNENSNVTQTKNIEEVATHDWECKYVIEDGYNGNGKHMFHYVDSYVRNVDRSISFVDDEGLVTTIPYPYFHIHVNPNKK